MPTPEHTNCKVEFVPVHADDAVPDDNAPHEFDCECTPCIDAYIEDRLHARFERYL